MDKRDIEGVLGHVSFPGYEFFVGQHELVDETCRYYIQASFWTEEFIPRVGTQREKHFTRKWYLSEHACRNEVVQTCLKLVLTSVEHEARESFKYRRRSIFGPHYDVDALHALAGADANLDYRR